MTVLVKLEPEQTATHWPLIKEAIFQSLPPVARPSEDRREHLSRQIQNLLLKDDLHVWFYPKDAIPPAYVIITHYQWDAPTETGSLCVYGLYAVPKFIPHVQEGTISSPTEWAKGLFDLEEFGKKMGCRQMIAYLPEDSKIKDILKAMDFDRMQCYTKKIEE